MSNVASAQRCQNLCQVYPGCAVFTFGSGGDRLGSCWLKYGGAVDSRTPKANRIAGPRVCEQGGGSLSKGGGGASPSTCQCGLANRPDQVKTHLIFRQKN